MREWCKVGGNGYECSAVLFSGPCFVMYNSNMVKNFTEKRAIMLHYQPCEQVWTSNII